MTIESLQTLLFFATLGGMIFALVRGRVIAAKLCVAVGLTALFALQMSLTPLDKKIHRLRAEVQFRKAADPQRAKAVEALAEAEAQLARIAERGVWYERLPLALGLDLRGGTEVRLSLKGDPTRLRKLEREISEKEAEVAAARTATPVAVPELEKALAGLREELADETASYQRNFESAVDVIRTRLNNSGLSEIPVTKMGGDNVLVQLPGMDTSRARQVIETVQRQGRLEFRLVLADNVKDRANADLLRRVQELGLAKDAPNISPDALRPLGPDEIDSTGLRDRKTRSFLVDWLRTPDSVKETGAEEKGRFHLVKKEPLLTGDRIVAARAEPDPERAGFQISVSLDQRGAALFERATGPHVGEPLGIVLDGKLKSAPVIQSALGAHFRITGDFDQAEAEQLAIVLKSGSLRVKIEKESETSVGPTLGEDSIRSGVSAMAVGCLIVILFMIGYYHVAGAVAIVAIAVNVLIVLWAMSLFDATLTLPGLAGLALTVGMGVDANVLIYERIRDEKDKGNPISRALGLGFDRAFVTILDANVTTILTALILHSFGTEAVRGFALTLVIGIAANIFCAVFLARWLFEALLQGHVIRDLSMYQLFRCPKFDYVAWRRPAMLASLAFITIGLLVFAWRGERNFSQDFTGGTLAQIALHEPLKIDAARNAALQSLGKEFPDVSVQAIGTGGREFVLRTKYVRPEAKEASEKKEKVSLKSSEEFKAAIRKAFPTLQSEGLVVGAPLEERSTSAHTWFPVRLTLETPVSPKALLDLLVAAQEGLTIDQRFADIAAVKTGDPLPEAPRSDKASVFAAVDRKDADGKELADEAAWLAALRKSLEKVPQDLLDLQTGLSAVAPAPEPDVPADKLRLRFRLTLKRPATDREILRLLEPDKAKKETSLLTRVTVELVEPQRPAAPATEPAPELTLLCAIPVRDALGTDRSVEAQAQLIIDRLHRLRDRKDLAFTDPFPRFSTIGPMVAGEMLGQALLALFYSIIAIAFYIWLRFQFRLNFSLGAAIALVHDVLLALGAIVIADELGLLNGQIDLVLVAAFLTIIGYSINDTIVIFDRIRENIHGGHQVIPVINDSINQTLSRTIITMTVTQFVVFALLVWGGDVLRGFSLALFVGFLTGAYSSVFIASPIIIEFELWRQRRRGGTAPATAAPGTV